MLNHNPSISNNIFAIITIVLAVIGYILAWKFLKKEKYAYAVFLLVVSGFILRLFTASDLFLHEWDEQYHALVAKNLMSHPLKPTLYDYPLFQYDYKSWVGNHVWLHKQPLPLWTMAGSMSLFGINEIAIRLPSILFTTIGIWLTFKIGSYFFSKKTGFIAAFFYSINGLIIELSAGRIATDHVDVHFLFYIELAIYLCILCAQRQKMIYSVLVGLTIGAAILCKWLPGLIVLPIWILMVTDSRKFSFKQIVVHFIVLFGCCLLVFLPWQIYIFQTYPLEAKWESMMNFKHFTEVIENRKAPFYYFLDEIRVSYGDLIYIPFVWFIWKTIKYCKDLKNAIICIWFLIPILFFSLAQTKMQGYILFVCPALFLITAEFWVMLSENKDRFKLNTWMIRFIMLLFIVLPVKFSFERIKPFSNMDRNPIWVQDLKQLKMKHKKKCVLFNYDQAVSAMFYTDFTAYPFVPDDETINDLKRKGYTIFMDDDGGLRNKNVIYLKLYNR